MRTAHSYAVHYVEKNKIWDQFCTFLKHKKNIVGTTHSFTRAYNNASPLSKNNYCLLYYYYFVVYIVCT
jgi:hypothetical protein